ncbi:ABC transporter substrate-binding protein [Streptomyces hirsutus]
MWVQKDSPIHALADLTGKTVGVPQIEKSAPWVDLRGSVDEAGGDSSSIKFIESPDPLAALKSGQVDATTTPEPVGTVERAKGDLRPLGQVNSGGGGIASSGYNQGIRRGERGDRQGLRRSGARGQRGGQRRP